MNGEGHLAGAADGRWAAEIAEGGSVGSGRTDGVVDGMAGRMQAVQTRFRSKTRPWKAAAGRMRSHCEREEAVATGEHSQGAWSRWVPVNLNMKPLCSLLEAVFVRQLGVRWPQNSALSVMRGGADGDGDGDEGRQPPARRPKLGYKGFCVRVDNNQAHARLSDQTVM